MPKRKRDGTPDPAGHFGPFGGRYVAETLMSALIGLEKAYREAWRDRSFHRELDGLLKSYAGRPTPLYFAERLTEKAGGAPPVPEGGRGTADRRRGVRGRGKQRDGDLHLLPEVSPGAALRG